MASAAILLIMAGCAVAQYLKGSLVKSFATFIAALCASFVALWWYEQLSAMLIKQETLVELAQPICFGMLFLVTFAVLQTASLAIAKQKIDFGDIPERIGRVVFGLLLGYVISGVLLIGVSMAPLPSNYPYQRFDAGRPDSKSPGKVMLNPDGFLAGWFGLISSGSVSGSQSFAVLHAGFIDELFLGRLDQKVKFLTDPDAVTMPAKIAAWPAPEGLKDSEGTAVSSRAGYELIIARVGFTNKMLSMDNSFIPGQLRLMCKKKGEKPRLGGSGVSVYPVGYFKSANQLRTKGLGERITLSAQGAQDGALWIDFVFYVPKDFEPVAVGLKANAMAEVPPMVPAEQTPKAVVFIPVADCATQFAKVAPMTSAKIYGLELGCSSRLLEGAMLKVSDRGEWTSRQAQGSAMAAQFEQERISCVKAELNPAAAVDPNQPQQEPAQNQLPTMLKPADGYALVSLKCNTPATGAAIPGEQLPVLIDSAGAVHHPCGLIAGGRVAGSTIFQVDYCSIAGQITIGEDGAVSKPFPDELWLAGRAQSMSQLYVLYMVKTNTIIVSVKPFGAQAGARLEGTEGLLAY